MAHNSLGITMIPTEMRISEGNILTEAINFRLAFPNEEKLKDAINYYNKVINRNPDDAFAYNNRGTIYNKLGQHQLAIEDYNQAIRLNPDYSLAYSNRGVACYMQGFKGKFCSKDQLCRDVEKACSLGDCKMLKLAKSYLDNKEFHYTKPRQYKIAIDDFNQLIFLKPDFIDAYNNGELTYSKDGQYQLVIGDFNKATSLKPDDAHYFNDIGINYSKRGKYKTAINNFNQAIRLKPDFVDAYNNRGLTYSKEGRYQLAIDDFSQAIRLKPDFASAYINRGVTYLTINKKEPGCLDARKACSLGNCKLLEMAKGKGYCR